MQHLSHQFCTENLLFFTNVLQWQDCLIDLKLIDVEHELKIEDIHAKQSRDITNSTRLSLKLALTTSTMSESSSLSQSNHNCHRNEGIIIPQAMQVPRLVSISATSKDGTPRATIPIPTPRLEGLGMHAGIDKFEIFTSDTEMKKEEIEQQEKEHETDVVIASRKSRLVSGSPIILPPTVPLSPIMNKLREMVKDVKTKTIVNNYNSDDENDDHDEFDFDFDVFVPIFLALYEKYIESDRAPLELNLCSESRNNLRNIYNDIVMKKRDIMIGKSKLMNQTQFWYLWHYLRVAARTTYSLIHSSARQKSHGQQKFKY